MTPTEGIFYVICLPSGWRLMAYRFDEEGEESHSSYWRHGGVAALLAKEWRPKTRIGAHNLTEGDLELLLYAFPRGRVTRVGAKYVVYHGKDIQPFMRITKQQIEKAFGITRRCRWTFDDHEQCQTSDKEEMRRLLGLKEDWSAV